jgi:hypothetical protein
MRRDQYASLLQNSSRCIAFLLRGGKIGSHRKYQGDCEQQAHPITPQHAVYRTILVLLFSALCAQFARHTPAFFNGEDTARLRRWQFLHCKSAPEEVEFCAHKSGQTSRLSLKSTAHRIQPRFEFSLMEKHRLRVRGESILSARNLI